MRVEFHPEADAEFVAALEWYDNELPGLGSTFLARVNAAVSAVMAMPRAAPHWPGLESQSVRRVLMRQFPFALVYTLRDQVLFIVAVAHLKRSPGYWLHRVTYH